MTSRIQPQEFHLQSSRDGGHVRTVVSKELLDDGRLLLQGIRLHQLDAGSSIIVQVTNHDYSRLLHECEFRVTRAQTVMVQDDEERTSQKTIYEVVRKTEWWAAPSAALEIAKAPIVPTRERYVPATGVVRWNLGQKVHEVVIGDKVVFATADKARALAVANGDVPIPEPESARI